MKLSRFLYGLIGLSGILMALGAGVRTMGAGLTCPDWPLCFGQVVPDFHPGVYYEFIHRVLAGIVGLLFLSGFVWVQFHPIWKRRIGRLAWFALGLLLAQIVMGGLTVLLLVKSVIVTMHLLLATGFIGSLLWICFRVRRFEYAGDVQVEPGETDVSGLGWIALAAPVLVYLQIAVGGLVASTFAGSVCIDWPLCNGKWIPTLSGAIGLQVIHRFIAYFLIGLFGAFAAWANTGPRVQRISSDIRHNAGALSVVALLQVGLGIMNLLLYVPAWLTVIHQSLAITLFGVSLRLAWMWLGHRRIHAPGKSG